MADASAADPLATAIAEGFVDISKEKNGGLLKKVLVEGSGEEMPPVGSDVKVHYVGTLHSDGSKFDSSRDRPGTFDFEVGVGQVIQGWDTGICSMKRGEKCILRCSPDYAYGARGSPPKIPPAATLNFEVELFSWKEKVKPPHAMTLTERLEYASKMKDAGTAALKKGELSLAVEHYEEGVRYATNVARDHSHGGHGHSHGGEPCSGHGDESDDDEMGHGEGKEEISECQKTLAVALLNNCAMAKLKNGDAESAKFDCTKVLEYEAENIKALFRRSQAELAMGNYSRSVEDSARVLEIDPQNKEAAQLRRKAADDEKKAKQKEKAMYSKMFG